MKRTPYHLNIAAQLMRSFIGMAPPVSRIDIRPGILLDKVHTNGAPIYARDNSIFNTSKYKPHQSKKECDRRIANKCGLWFTPIKIKGAA